MLAIQKISTTTVRLGVLGLLLSLSACQNQPYSSRISPNTIAPNAPVKTVTTPAKAVTLPLNNEKLQYYVWQLTAVTDTAGKPVLQGLFHNTAKPLLVTFEKGGNLRLNNTCNKMWADYMLTNDNVVVGDFASTRMMCEPALMAMDSLAPTTLKGQFKLTLDGAGEPVLTVTHGNQVSTFKPVAKH